jgi:cytochrome P450
VATRTPPHPKDKGPLLGSVPDLGRDFVGTFVRGWHEVGDVCVFRGPRPMCLVAHPDAVQHVMIERQSIYPRSEPVIDGLSPIMGDGSFVADDRNHALRRPILDAVLGEAAVAEYAGGVSTATEQMLARWERGGERVLDVEAEMTGLAIDIATAVFFGGGQAPDPQRLRAALTTAVNYAVPRIMLPVSAPEFLRLPPYRRFRRALADLDAMVYPAITARRRAIANNETPGGDVLSALLTSKDADGAGLSDRQVRDEVLTSLFGAFKGIGPALTWTWYLLSTHPDVAERVSEESVATLGERSPEAADVASLSYTLMVLHEVLRLYPPLWLWSRPPTQDDVIGGYRISAGMFVLCVPYVTHRHPDFWPNPDAFDPQRFAAGAGADRHPFAYFPFGGGVRRCTGDRLSLMVLPLVIAAVARRFTLELRPGHEPRVGMDFMLRPQGGMPMTVRSRA